MKSCLVSVLFLLFISACSSAQKGYQVRSFIPDSLMIRRPTGTVVDPKVGPGGEDYASQPSPDSRFNCQDPEKLFEKTNLKRVRSCLSRANRDKKHPQKVHYRLVLDPAPIFELEEIEKEKSSCLQSVLPVIPVPREIVFQTESERELDQCLSSRIPIGADRVLGIQFPIQKVRLTLQFPLSQLPKNEKEMRQTLFGWALAPFFQGKEADERVIQATLVPKKFCVACLGVKKIYQNDPLSPYLPYEPQQIWPQMDPFQ